MKPLSWWLQAKLQVSLKLESIQLPPITLNNKVCGLYLPKALQDSKKSHLWLPSASWASWANRLKQPPYLNLGTDAGGGGAQSRGLQALGFFSPCLRASHLCVPSSDKREVRERPAS